MEVRRTLIPDREILVVFALLLCAMAAVLLSADLIFPALHSILDTAVFLLSALLAFLLWDMGWRTNQLLPRLEAMCFTVVAVLELLHVITALNFPETAPLRPAAQARHLVAGGLSTAGGPAAGAVTQRPRWQRCPGSRSACWSWRRCSWRCSRCRATASRSFSASRGPRCSSRRRCGSRSSSSTGASATPTASRACSQCLPPITLFVPLIMLYSQGPADKVAVHRALRAHRRRALPVVQPHADGHRRHRATHAGRTRAEGQQ